MPRLIPRFISSCLKSLLFFSLFVTGLLMASNLALAQTQQEVSPYLIRRVVVFPFQVEDSSRTPAEQSWWRVREMMTDTRRFLLASRQFLTNKQAFQPRSNLKISDVILLGKLLDATSLVTFVQEKRTLVMKVYSCENGRELWSKTLDLHPSLPIAEQILSGSEKLMTDFIASMPYQGFVVTDPLIGKALYQEGDIYLAHVDLGAKHSVQAGEAVQWLKLETQTESLPSFQGGVKTTVIAEGEVLKIEQDIATVEVKRVLDKSLLVEKSLVRIPKEAERLQAQNPLFKTGQNFESLRAELLPVEKKESGGKSFATALAAVANLVAMVLLAF